MKMSIIVQKTASKWVKNRVFELVKYLVINFFLNLVYNENLFHLLNSCRNPISGKYLVLEIWVKMHLTNHIAKFLNQLYL